MGYKEASPYRLFDIITQTGAAIAGYTETLCGEWCPERFERLGNALGVMCSNMILANEAHTDCVRIVDAANSGYGVINKHDQNQFDAMITQETGMLLCVHTADCVPLVLLDPTTHSAGIVHSGWVGTSNHIAGNAIKKMKEVFHCDAANMICAMGPYNHSCCYEVGEDVLIAYRRSFSKQECEMFFSKGQVEGKYMLNLGAAVSFSLCREGVPEKNIYDCGCCTFHTSMFSSWRRTGDSKRQMLTFIMLR